MVRHCCYHVELIADTAAVAVEVVPVYVHAVVTAVDIDDVA